MFVIFFNKLSISLLPKSSDGYHLVFGAEEDSFAEIESEDYRYWIAKYCEVSKKWISACGRDLVNVEFIQKL